MVPHTSKTRILNLWNPTPSPLKRSVVTQSPQEEEQKSTRVEKSYLLIFRNLALIETITVLIDMRAAPIAGLRSTPYA